MKLGDNTDLIPVEKALICVEVKSTLKREDFIQISKQISEVQKLVRATIGRLENSDNSTPYTPTIHSIIALDNRVGQDSIIKFMQEQPQLMTVCCIGDRYLRRTGYDSLEIEATEGTEDYYETRRYLCGILNLMNDSIDYRSKVLTQSDARRVWETYILDPSQV